MEYLGVYRCVYCLLSRDVTTLSWDMIACLRLNKSLIERLVVTRYKNNRIKNAFHTVVVPVCYTMPIEQ